MKVLIVEDEAAAVARMRSMLAAIDPAIVVLAALPTVQATVEWIAAGGKPDLAFLDVRLADGDSFAIFETVEMPCPVVFTTAYDAYALNAFRVHALDYLLKPVRRADLAGAIDRARQGGVLRDHRPLAAAGTAGEPLPVKRFLIRYGDRFKVVEPPDIAYVHSLEKNTFIRTREGRDLPLEESLDRLEKQLDPGRFTRLNRRLIVQIDSIREIVAYSKSRVKVLLDPDYGADAVVSSERAAAFKRWLAGR